MTATALAKPASRTELLLDSDTLPPQVIAELARVERVVREHRIKLAMTPKTRRVGCAGCFDLDNINHPTGGEPRRCSTCPVTRKLRRRRKLAEPPTILEVA